MTDERLAWYSVPVTVTMTPREMTEQMFQATKKMCDEPNNALAKKYFEEIGPVSRDIFLAALVFAVVGNPPE